MATILYRNIQYIHYDCHVFVPLVADLPPDLFTVIIVIMSPYPAGSYMRWL